AFACDARGDEWHAEDLGVRVGDGCAGKRAVILEHADVPRSSRHRPITIDVLIDYARCDIGSESIERRSVICSLDNDLVVVGRRIFVRKYANLPWMAVAPDFRRRISFVSTTKRTAIGLIAKRVGTRSATRGDDDRVAG